MNKPQIRFKGFESELKLHTLADLGSWSKGQPLSKSDIGNGPYPCIHYGELFSYPEFISKINSHTFIEPTCTSKGCELLFPDSDVTPTGLGRCCSISETGVILGTGINILSLKSGLDSHYCALNVVRNKSQIIERVSGTTVRHINPKNLNEVVISISPDLLEQSIIGNYFRQLDEMIVEVEREISRLEKIKQASLQNIFPRPGAATPEIRFAGFSGPWKDVKLGELGIWQKGQSLSKSDISDTAHYPCLHYGQLFAEEECIYNIRTFTNKEPIITSCGNEILFPDSDVTPTGLGRCCCVLEKGVILGSGINIFCLKESMVAHFVALNVTCNKYQIIEQVTGTTVKHIHPKSLSEIIISIPDSSEEQETIAEYFRNLDALISAKRQKLTKLRNIKQACLDKMFVNTSEL